MSMVTAMMMVVGDNEYEYESYYRYPMGTYIFTAAESDARMTSQAPHTGQ